MGDRGTENSGWGTKEDEKGYGIKLTPVHARLKLVKTLERTTVLQWGDEKGNKKPEGFKTGLDY